MNHVFTRTQAAGSTASGNRLARIARNGMLACVLACTAAGAMAAGQDRGPRRDELQQQQSMRERYDDSRFDARAQEQRAYEMQMREQAQMRERDMRNSMREDGGRRARMTPDERNELKRQINEANRDLYPNARRR